MATDPCTCGHKESTHRYIAIVGENSGDCLSPVCQCKIYEKAEK